MALRDYFAGIKLPAERGERMQTNQRIAEAVSKYLDNEAEVVTSDEITDVFFELLGKEPQRHLRSSMHRDYLANQANPFLKLTFNIKRKSIRNAAREHLVKQGKLEKGIGLTIKGLEHISMRNIFYKDPAKIDEYLSKRLKKVAVRYEFSIVPIQDSKE